MNKIEEESKEYNNSSRKNEKIKSPKIQYLVLETEKDPKKQKLVRKTLENQIKIQKADKFKSQNSFENTSLIQKKLDQQNTRFLSLFITLE